MKRVRDSDNPRTAEVWLYLESRLHSGTWWRITRTGLDRFAGSGTGPEPAPARALTLTATDVRLVSKRPVSTTKATRVARLRLGKRVRIINYSLVTGAIYARPADSLSGGCSMTPLGLVVESLVPAAVHSTRPAVVGVSLGGAPGECQILALWAMDGYGQMRDLEYTENAQYQSQQIINEYCARHGLQNEQAHRLALFDCVALYDAVTATPAPPAYPNEDMFLGVPTSRWWLAAAGGSLAACMALAVDVVSLSTQAEHLKTAQARLAAEEELIRSSFAATIENDLPLLEELGSLDVTALVRSASSVTPPGGRATIHALERPARISVAVTDSAATDQPQLPKLPSGPTDSVVRVQPMGESLVMTFEGADREMDFDYEFQTPNDRLLDYLVR